MSVYFKDNATHLEQCLRSIWTNQYVKPTEIVLVKDGKLSSELEQIITHWQNKLNSKFIVVALSENLGLGKALNEGLKHCHYSWVFRMDADDICLPDRFEKQVQYIKQNPDVVLVGAQIEEFDEKMEHNIGLRKVPTSTADIYRIALSRNPFNHMTVAYKKRVIEDVGGYQHHLYMEDYNLWLRVIAKGYKVVNLESVLVNVRSGLSMYARRKGLNYVVSEYQLAKLKNNLGMQSILLAYFYFLVRTLPRFFPSFLLGKVYQFLRKSN
uniref:Putative glycosyltransferase n=2 Tax=Glaesserella parasuis TaxID=738 RepID=T1RNT9_GLAPU|nr:putative glycosyltransferase [Glaesserella parasuis]